MADLELRLNKDMLVMSSPVSRALDLLGMTSLHDQAYALLFEPEVIEEVYKLESMTGVQCVVADTAIIVPAELARQYRRILVAGRQRCNLYCPWSSFAVDSNERFETKIGFEGRTYAPDSGNYR